jgi:hypothetical protein
MLQNFYTISKSYYTCGSKVDLSRVEAELEKITEKPRISKVDDSMTG